MDQSKSTKQTILIVEDETILRTVVAKKLKKEGYTILEAENGEIGLYRAIEHHPDLILLDILMPVMDGVTMLKKLREDKWGKSAHVVFLTNLSDAEGMQDAKAYNVTDYLVKADWSLDNLAQQVEKML